MSVVWEGTFLMLTHSALPAWVLDLSLPDWDHSGSLVYFTLFVVPFVTFCPHL